MKAIINNHNKNILGAKPSISTTTRPLNETHRLCEETYANKGSQPVHQEEELFRVRLLRSC